MFRRAVWLGTVLAAALAPSARAADTFVIEGAAASTPSAGQMAVTFECAAADTAAVRVDIWRCEVGQVRGISLCPVGCERADAAAGAGLMPATNWELCVGATSYGALTRSFHTCEPRNSLTGTAVVLG